VTNSCPVCKIEFKTVTVNVKAKKQDVRYEDGLALANQIGGGGFGDGLAQISEWAENGDDDESDDFGLELNRGQQVPFQVPVQVQVPVVESGSAVQVPVPVEIDRPDHFLHYINFNFDRYINSNGLYVE
jgi:hypothetical protein